MIYIRFVIDGEPRGKGRPRFTKSGHAFTDQKTRDYEKLIGYCYKAQGGRMLEGDIDISIKAFYKIAKNDNKNIKAAKRAGEIKPTKKPDIDNIIKAILDGLNEVAYKDDAQVVNVSASKYYSDEPRVEVIVSRI